MMRGVSGCIRDVERAAPFPKPVAVLNDSQVFFGNGEHCTPQLRHSITEKPGGAGHQTRRIHQVWRAALVHKHVDLGVGTDQRTARAGVVEVNVRDEHGANVQQADAGLV